MSERTLLRLGGAAAVVGAIVAFLVFMARPVQTGDIVDDPAATLQEILDSDVWVTLHVVMLFAILLIFGSLGVFSRSINTQKAAAWGRFGFFAAAIGTAVFLVVGGSDAIGIKGVAKVWEGASAGDKGAALVTAQAFDAVNLGIFSMWITLFFGLAPVLIGLAIVISDVYPKWLGWAAIVVGLGSVAAGLNEAFIGGADFLFVFVLLVFLWLVVMGVFLWRKAGTVA